MHNGNDGPIQRASARRCAAGTLCVAIATRIVHFHQHARLRGVIAVRRAVQLVLVILCCTSCSANQPSDSIQSAAADTTSLALLHSRDVKAVLAGDTATLMSLWTKDIVSLSARGPIRRGFE